MAKKNVKDMTHRELFDAYNELQRELASLGDPKARKHTSLFSSKHAGIQAVERAKAQIKFLKDKGRRQRKKKPQSSPSLRVVAGGGSEVTEDSDGEE